MTENNRLSEHLLTLDTVYITFVVRLRLSICVRRTCHVFVCCYLLFHFYDVFESAYLSGKDALFTVRLSIRKYPVGVSLRPAQACHH